MRTHQFGEVENLWDQSEGLNLYFYQRKSMLAISNDKLIFNLSQNRTKGMCLNVDESDINS